jgi:MobA/MobL family
VAIYHLSVKPISRGVGRSATAAAAYRSGELVHDLSTDEVFDYTRKRGVEHSEIVLPTEAARQDINWARDREALWNAAEIAEKRKDARVAREYEVALPHELTNSQRADLVRAFAGELANRYGVAVDFSIHAPHREGDERNTHAHIMTTTRRVLATGLGEKASIEWSDTDRAKKGLEPSKVEVKAIRERWAMLTNEHLKERGIEARVDHRSLEAQGIDRVPTSHLGPAVSGMERRGIATEVVKRISLELASERLARAAEIGKLERERAEVRQSMLDLSGDLKNAQRERDRFSGLKLGTPAADRGADRELPARPSDDLPQAAEGYARAFMDGARMREQGLPILEHQRVELEKAGRELDRLRPGAAQDLRQAFRYEPQAREALRRRPGAERAQAMVEVLKYEDRVRKDPALKADRIMKAWRRLEGEHKQLEKGEERTRVEEQLQGLTREIKGNDNLQGLVRDRYRSLGLSSGESRLGAVLEERDLKRALTLSLGRGRDYGLEM